MDEIMSLQAAAAAASLISDTKNKQQACGAAAKALGNSLIAFSPFLGHTFVSIPEADGRAPPETEVSICVNAESIFA